MTLLVLGMVAAAAAAVFGALQPRLRARSHPWGLACLGVAALTLAGATGQLLRALLANDFSYAYVADVSRRDASTTMQIAALWGGMAGSLLWFTTLLAIVGTLAVHRSRGRVAAPGPMLVAVGGLVTGLSALMLGWANPFEKLAVPAVDGRGLTPVLEHPAMAYHPPLLYLGLTTLAAPFALVVAGVAAGPRARGDWAETARRWLLVPWVLLAVGMVAGAHWAYVVLGWGGYWAWDPVENTALLPWLATTMALHGGYRPLGGGSNHHSGPRGAFGERAFAALVCVAFVLALLGTMLTRSGAVGSVHAFAESPTIGWGLGLLVSATIVALVALFGLTRTGSWRETHPGSARVSAGTGIGNRLRRRTLLGAHLVIVGTTLVISFAGTAAPLVAELRGGTGIAVEGRYFAGLTGPLAVTGLALMAFLPLARRLGRWRPHAAPAAPGADGADRGDTRPSAVLVVPAAGVLGGAGLLLLAGGDLDPPRLALGGAAGAAAAAAVLDSLAALRGRDRRRLGGHLAHLGMGVLLLGVAGTATGTTQVIPVRPDSTVEVQGHEIGYRGVGVQDGPRRGSASVVAEVRAAGRELRPSLDSYREANVLVAESALVSTPLWDMQVSLRNANDDGNAILEVGVHPLQMLVWWGGLLVAGGGVIMLWPRRRAASTSATDSEYAYMQR